MANKAHLKQIQKGALAWNSWRRAYKVSRPDLSGADLSGLSLNFVDFSNTNLVGADLSETDLDLARLFRADFTNATLVGAKLTSLILIEANFSLANLSESNISGGMMKGVTFQGTNFSGALFSDADLTEINMSGASLLDVRFHKTHLTDVNWSMVELGGTHLETMDLSRVLGLTTCRHTRPSKIDYSTIKRSRLPFSFLRGVGIPDAELKNLPDELSDQALARSLTEAAEARDFFRKTFERLTAERDVQKRGYLLERFLKDFFAFEGMTPRASFRLLGEQIDGAFIWADRVFLLEAKWVKDPIGGAALLIRADFLSRSMVILPMPLRGSREKAL
jgi:uncharacterized protein YjbI with pentapeptide repeats